MAINPLKKPDRRYDEQGFRKGWMARILLRRKYKTYREALEKRDPVYISFLCALVASVVLSLVFGIPFIDRQYMDILDKARLFMRSDLVIEARPLGLDVAEKGPFDAIQQDPRSYQNETQMMRDMPFKITFLVRRIAKGQYDSKRFTILVKSPAPFKLSYPRDRFGSSKRYRLYFHSMGNGRTILGHDNAFSFDELFNN